MAKRGSSEEFSYTEKQLETLWNQCHELKDRFLVGLTAYCGLRIGEAIHLRLSWIKEQEIHIPSSMPCQCWGCGSRGYWKPKTKSGVRVIPIPQFLKPVMLEFLHYQPDGLSITRQAAWHKIQALAKRAKLPHLFPHALRASYATLLASKGMEAAAICYLLGWSRLEVAQSYIRVAHAKQIAQTQIKQIFG